MKKHLIFCSETLGGPDGIHVYNIDNEFLGSIIYCKNWKCYVWEQRKGIIMSKSCLDELTEYMGKLEK